MSRSGSKRRLRDVRYSAAAKGIADMDRTLVRSVPTYKYMPEKWLAERGDALRPSSRAEFAM
jgi:hypothetical protein